LSPDHEYTVHEVPHPDITDKDNYFKSITEVSRFTNPHFTRELKVEVKRRAGNKCECCGRSWQDVETFDDERFYFETLSWQDIESLNDFKKLPELATKTLIGYRYATITDGLHKNGKPRERIVQLFPETCKNCRAHLSWFIGFSNLKPIKASRWFQVPSQELRSFRQPFGKPRISLW